MYFDAVTIMALVDELNDTIAGGRVQDSVEINEDSFGLEVYAHHVRQYLVISADQQFARVHLGGEKLRRGVQKPSPLGLLLRRYVEGARIEAVRQPAWERVIVFEMDGPEGVFELIAEPMERRANLLLVRDDGIIVDCARRVGPQENRVRISLPNRPYEPPPPQKTKRDPGSLALTLLGDMLDVAPGEQARQVLTRHLLGFSPLVAREAVFRATGSTTTRAADTSARTLLNVIEDLFGAFGAGQWEPGNAIQDEQVDAFAAYRLTHLDGWTPVASISEALERFYGPMVGEGAYAAAKQPVQAAIVEAKERVSKKLESLRRSLQDDAALEHLRQSGELLLAYQYTLTRGQTELRAQYEVDGPELVIELDPSMSPLDNAQRYFEKYDKAKRAREGVPQLVEAAEQELAYLEQLESDLALASNWPEIGEVQEALQAGGYWRGKRVAQPGGGKSGPLKVAADDGFVIWVGRNSRQNDAVTFDKGTAEDLWLHARGVPGAHVIIKSAGRDVPDGVLRRAASLAAFYSQARTEARVLVDVTQRKHVRKIKGGKPGMVTYRNESPVEVVPSAE
ncbi:MAG TPA: NFACT RNA binding domain-containing protein [Aggregatilinea sp.]|uniref:Rqc2 family fibronectin-binding protein n=1 Tax=Aggregatilinea sp. TaxID=2806333 RepID=UPI002C57C59B|nr:NFACT RNA binding domain-containing protein [Aggregatilinea sp.]HML24697.1 NFACT RNA binding domain-containing protein [Aggregatilinea sp.]